MVAEMVKLMEEVSFLVEKEEEEGSEIVVAVVGMEEEIEGRWREGWWRSWW